MFSAPEFIVRGFIKCYNNVKGENIESTRQPRNPRGEKSLLPAEIDENTLSMIKIM